MDEDDTIIEEIPVFLSKNLAQNIYILQYPVKNSDCTFDNAQVINSCVKPLNQQLKIDFALNTASRHYDAFKGEQMAIMADGKDIKRDSKERPTFQSGTMDKQTFISTKPVDSTNSSRYVVGMISEKDHQKEMHLVPVQSILQMRQTFSYFDKQDKRTKEEKRAEEGADDEVEDLKQVTVKFARADNDKLKKAREKSYNFISQIGSDEPWCETLWHPNKSYESEMEKQKIIYTSNQIFEGGNDLNLPIPDYLNDLLTNPQEENIVVKQESTSPTPSTSSNTTTAESPVVNDIILSKKEIGMSKLKKLPLIDQIKLLLRDAKVVSFNSLMEFLKDSKATTERVLRQLPLVAVLVKGNWVLQSDLLYPDGTVSGINGVQAEYMRRARDYVLFQLQKVEFLNRPKISSVTQIPAEETKEILESVAKLRINKGWELLQPPDLEFEAKYPEIVQRQEIYWKVAQESKFNELENEKPEKRIRKKSFRDSKT